jgi:hypothetical protein
VVKSGIATFEVQIHVLTRPRAEGWAHQDSNLERAGYEPAALTVELWARHSLAFPYDVLPSKNARSLRLREGWRSLRSALASI